MLYSFLTAKAAGLPYVNPSLNKSLDHSKGVNFAVGGTGVLSKEARKKWNVVFPFSNSSLDVQLHRFDQFLQKTFKTKIARERHLKSSLFFINGGFNDYQFLQSRAGLSVLEQKKLIMPEIVQGLGNAVKKFISYGARKIIVVGVHPVGCAPGNSTNTKTAGTSTIHCNKETSEYLVLHNKLLQKSINQWRRRFSDARIVYGDVYDAGMWVLNHCHALGFRYPQTRCCGTPTKYCGARGSPYCKNPKEYVFWDGLHLTDAAYRDVYHRMIPQIASGLQCGRKNA
ncbi:GDSL esterase/lipase At5g45910 [Linum perenne]